MSQVALFGLETKGPPRPRLRKKTETFDLDADLSPGERQLVASHLVALAGDNHKIVIEAQRYANCGTEALPLLCPACRTAYFVRVFCRSRLCERCARIYAKDLRGQLLPAFRDVSANRRKGYVLALLTLTVSSRRWGDGLPSREHIKRLYRETSQFFRLHYGKYAGRWSRTGKVTENRKRYVGAGWVAVLEVGKDNNNAHCHAVVYGPIRDWFKLRASWEKITGDSRGVDIRKIHSSRAVVDYVLKYVTKPPGSDSYARIAAYGVMIKGSRRLRSGGIFYNRFKRIERDKPACRCVECNSRLDCEPICLLSDVSDRLDLYAEIRSIESSDLPAWLS